MWEGIIAATATRLMLVSIRIRGLVSAPRMMRDHVVAIGFQALPTITSRVTAEIRATSLLPWLTSFEESAQNASHNPSSCCAGQFPHDHLG